MSGWLLDTNVLSELSRTHPHPLVHDFIESLPATDCLISTVTLAEIRYGIALIEDVNRRAGFDLWLREVRERFAESVAPVTEETMFIWRSLMARGRKANRTYSQPDLILAATAIERDVTLATRNVKDFRDLPLRVINPWMT